MMEIDPDPFSQLVDRVEQMGALIEANAKHLHDIATLNEQQQAEIIILRLAVRTLLTRHPDPGAATADLRTAVEQFLDRTAEAPRADFESRLTSVLRSLTTGMSE